MSGKKPSLAEQMKGRVSATAVPVASAFDQPPTARAAAPQPEKQTGPVTGETVVTSIAIPTELHKALRRQALDANRTLNDYLVDAAKAAAADPSISPPPSRPRSATKRTTLTLPATLHKDLRRKTIDMDGPTANVNALIIDKLILGQGYASLAEDFNAPEAGAERRTARDRYVSRSEHEGGSSGER